MKKIMAILLMLALTLTLVACGDSAAPSANEGGGAAAPDGFPTKPIQIIVPSSAGGGTDVMIRALVAEMDLPQPITIVNREGASGTIGTAEVAATAADGYTLVSGMPAPFFIQPNITELTFQIEDFRNLSLISPEEQLVIVVTPDSPIQSFEDLQAAMESGEDLKFGTSNPGSVGHCGLADLFNQMGVLDRFEMVPFQGAAEALTSLMGGHIDITTCDLAEAVPRILNEQVIPIAVFGDTRCGALPETPCLGELGYVGTDYAVAFKWISVPKDTPDEICDYLKAEIDRAVMSEGYASFIMDSNGLETYTMTEEELTQKLIDYRVKYGEILQMIGLAG